MGNNGRRLDRGSITRIALLLWVLMAFGAVSRGQSGTLSVVTPNSGAQGTAVLAVTFTLGSNPPAPPLDAPLQGAQLGDLSGTAVTRVDSSHVSAVFSIPADEPLGAKAASVTFTGPSGAAVFSLANGFTITTRPAGAPTVTQHPQSDTATAGSSATFTIVATGNAPLTYQWQKNRENLAGTTDSTLTIDMVTANDAGAYRCIVTNPLGNVASNEATLDIMAAGPNKYPIVDTGQTACYNATSVIAPPAAGAPFYGQDAQFAGSQPHYTLSVDTLTVHDDITELTWQRSPDTSGDGNITAADKLTWMQAQARPAVLNALEFGGYNDWRLPTIKELYSLINFTGTDPSGMTGNDTSGLTPFINTSFFHFAYGDTGAGERVIDSQYASSNLYVGPVYDGEGGKLFGVNFADGRIKGYGLKINGSDKTFFVQCVRGNPNYGLNLLVDNGDQTITDRATGLTWTKGDSLAGMNWQDALNWVQTKNAANYLGYSDWRLPNAKELQSILDYTRSPDTSGSAAINPLFTCTQISNEQHVADYPWYWTGTTHGAYNGTGSTADYLCFGRAMGYMDSTWVDVHGAGCQRSDPKAGSLSSYTYVDFGYYNSVAPQGDAVRIANYVRLVRTASNAAKRAWTLY